MPTRIFEKGDIMRFAASIMVGVVALAGVAPGPAQAGLFGHKKSKTDFSATLPPPPPPAQPANGAIYQAVNGYAPLHEGWRARRVGDPLTIVLTERTFASKSATSTLDSSGNLGITPPSSGPFSFNPNAATASGTRSFSGSGAADQSNNLSGELSVTVAEVYSNGTMLVQGGKRVTLNRGDEFVQIKGIVRSADIDAENRVQSTRVADAQIAYTGKGDVARASRQGWLSRFFSVVSPF